MTKKKELRTLVDPNRPYSDPQYTVTKDSLMRTILNGVANDHAESLNKLANLWLEEKYGIKTMSSFLTAVEEVYGLYFKAAKMVPFEACYNEFINMMEDDTKHLKPKFYLVDRPLEKIFLLLFSALTYQYDVYNGDIIGDMGRLYGNITAIYAGNIINVYAENELAKQIVPLQDLILLLTNIEQKDYKELAVYTRHYLDNSVIEIDKRDKSRIDTFNIYQYMDVIIAWLLNRDDNEDMTIDDMASAVYLKVVDNLSSFHPAYLEWLPIRASKDSSFVTTFMKAVYDVLMHSQFTLTIEEWYREFNKVWVATRTGDE